MGKEDHPLALFGETMGAVHSIEYDGLASYFYLFAVFDTTTKMWLSWKVGLSLVSALLFCLVLSHPPCAGC